MRVKVIKIRLYLKKKFTPFFKTSGGLFTVTNNFYAVLQRQANLDEEVSHIVYGNQKLAAPAVRKKRGKSCAAGQNKEKVVPRRQKAD